VGSSPTQSTSVCFSLCGALLCRHRPCEGPISHHRTSSKRMKDTNSGVNYELEQVWRPNFRCIYLNILKDGILTVFWNIVSKLIQRTRFLICLIYMQKYDLCHRHRGLRRKICWLWNRLLNISYENNATLTLLKLCIQVFIPKFFG
jgi:hypothetical protein